MIKKHLKGLNSAIKNTIQYKKENIRRSAEEKYASVFNSVNDAIFIIDTDTYRIIDINKRVFDLFGFTKEEFSNIQFHEVSDVDNAYTEDLIIEYINKAKSGSPVFFEWKGKHKNGKVFWSEIQMKQVKIDRSNYLIVIVKDTDNEKRALIRLKESEEHYRVLTENSPDVIMRFDRNHKHLFVNQAVRKIVPLKPEDFINKSHSEMNCFPKDLCKLWEDSIEIVFIEKKPHELDFQIDGDQGKIYLEWRIFPEFDKKGEVQTVLTIARDISSRIISEYNLLNSESRLKMALDAANDGLWDINMETNQVYYSPRYFAMLGYNSEDFNHDIFILQKLLHPEDRKRIMEIMQNFLNNTNEFIEYEMRLRKKDGSFAWILSRGKVFKNDTQGKPLRIVGTHVDITERKKQENIQNTLFEIANSVNTTRNLPELFISIQHALGAIMDTKNCYIALYDEINDNISLPFHQDEKDTFTVFPAGKTLTKYVIKTGKTQLVSKKRAEELEKENLIESIGTPSESWLGVPLKHGDKNIGVFTVQSYDEKNIFNEEDLQILEFVSDQVALAIERKRDQDSLIENQARQASIIESSPDGFIVIESNGIIREHNSSILEMLKIESGTIANRNFLDFITPGNIEKVKNALIQTLESGFKKNVETRIIRDDGTDFFAETSFGIVSDKGSETKSFVIIIKDISERKNYEANLKIAKNKAEESDRLKTAFLSNMSHEIRTPMNAIIGFAELLSVREVNDQEKKEFIEQINHGAETLMRLIDDIIDISKIEAGQLIIHNCEFMLSELMNDLKFIFNKILVNLNKSHIRLVEDNHNHYINIPIYTDQFRLKQIFSNLLSNAIKFTEFGEIKYGIKSLQKGVITFYVKDTGIGIDKGKLKLIFERFRQGHESTTKLYSGTGLGLAISKNLTELMGGKISVKSTPGMGAEFKFSMPFQATSPTKFNKPSDINATKYFWSGKTVLIAEDDESNFLFMKEALKKSKINILHSRSGEEVIDIFMNRPGIDLVLMDIQLPGKDGYETTRLLKEVNARIPIIAQTAYAMAGEKQRCLAAGCNDYIAKPIKLNDLYVLMDYYLSRK